jgi:hypothetical protein
MTTCIEVLTEVTADNFEPWSGGRDRWQSVNWETREALFDIIAEWAGDEPQPETFINDCLWFEHDELAQSLGYEDWEALEEECGIDS